MRTMVRAAVVAALGSSLGCRQVVGIETRSEGPPLLPLSEGCMRCVESSCSDAERACAGDADCAMLVKCIAQAGIDNPVARQACIALTPRGAVTSAFATLDACSRGACLDDCYGPAGFFADYPATCEACTVERCLDGMRSCVGDAECERGAVAAYGDPNDLSPPPIRTFALAPGSNDEPHRLLTDCSYTCALECGFSGENLDCVSDFAWAKPATDEVAIDVYVELFDASFHGSPLAMASVEACDAISADCVPTKAATTDATGHARFDLPINPISGFRGFFRITGETPSGPMFPVHAMAYPIIADSMGTAYAMPQGLFDEFVPGRLEGRAHLVVVVFDCALHRAPGLTLELPPSAADDSTNTIYLNGRGATSGDGLALVSNVLPGCYQLVARDGEGQETHRLRISASPDVMTLISLEPTSAPPDLGNTCRDTYD